MVEKVMTPAEIAAEKAERVEKIKRVAKWAPLGLAGLLLAIGSISAMSAVSGGESDAVLVKEVLAERKAEAEEAEAKLNAGFEDLVKGVTGLSAERAVGDEKVIRETIEALSANKKSEAESWPEAAEALVALGALGGSEVVLDTTLRTTGITASDYSYFAVTTAWDGKPRAEGAQALDAVAFEVIVAKDGSIVGMAVAPIGEETSTTDDPKTPETDEKTGAN